MIWRSTIHQRIAQLADFLTIELAVTVSFFLWELLHLWYPADIPVRSSLSLNMTALYLILGVMAVLLFQYYRAYSYQRFTSLMTEYLIVIKVSITLFLLTTAVLFLMGHKDEPRTMYLISIIVGISLLIIQKTVLFIIARLIRRGGKNRKRVIVLGTREPARHFISTVRNNFGWGLDIIGVITEQNESGLTELLDIPILGCVEDIEEIMRTYGPEEVIVSFSIQDFHLLEPVLQLSFREGIVTRWHTDFIGRFTKDVRIDNVYGLQIITTRMLVQSELELFLKRVIDIVGAIVALIIFSPFILFAALCVVIIDGWPPFYSYTVIGQNRKPIKVTKIRTMVRGAEKMKEQFLDQNEMSGPVFKINNDPRILPKARWIRKFSIDETPQLLNVLKGEISLVGPRPPGPHEFERFESWHRRKASIKPGLTCLWQISGRATINDFDEWIKLDLEYIDTWSLWLDIKILFKTIPAVLSGHGAS